MKNNVIPNYAIIRLKGSSVAESKTKKYAEIYRVKEEIKSLYTKKSNLYYTLYKLHLQLLDNTHPAVLNHYLDFINNDVRRIVYQMRIKQSDKLQRLFNDQLPISSNFKCKHKFYTRLQNLTSLVLNTDETDLLSKGLKYNLPIHKSSLNRKHIIAEIINAETVFKAMVDQKDRDETRFRCV